MKKLLSLLLVLTMMLGLIGGAFALADEAVTGNEQMTDAGDPPAKPEGAEGEEPPAPPAEGEEPPAKPEGGEGEEPPAKPEGEEGQEPPAKPEGEEGQEPPAKPEDGEDPAGGEPSAPPADEGGVDPGAPSEGVEYAIANNGGTIVAVEFRGQIDDASLIWEASIGSRGALLMNGDNNLYYSSTEITADTNGKGNWGYDGAMYYSGAGKTYISGVSGTTVTASTSGGCAVRLLDVDTHEDASGFAEGGRYVIIVTGGEVEPGDDTGDDTGDDAGDDSSDGYSQWRGPFQDVEDGIGIAIVIDDKCAGIGHGQVGTITASYNGEGDDATLVVETGDLGNALIVKNVEGGYSLYVNDPPGNFDYLYIAADGNLACCGMSGYVPNGYWTINEGGGPSSTTFAYNDLDTGNIWYLTLNADGNIVGTLDASEKITGNVYSGSAPEGGGGGGGKSSVDDVDEDGPIIVSQPETLHFVYEGSGYEAPVYTVTAELPEGSTATLITFQWFVNGSAVDFIELKPGPIATSTLTAADLADQPYGVYPVYCVASCTAEDGEVHQNTSYTTNFIVCKGVLENSVLTFSDVHEGWNDVGTAVYNTMIANDGLIPALVISTGDFNNAYLTGNPWDIVDGDLVANDNYDQYYRKEVDKIIGQINMQLAGIDTVWVSGNHDNGYAAGYTNWNYDIDLGMVIDDYVNLEENISGTGIIFDTRSEAYEANADSSQAVDGLIVIGVNFEDSMGGGNGTTGGRYEGVCDYGDGTEEHDSVYKHLVTALDSIAANYNGEIVIISSHAGLHVLGVDPSSVAAGVTSEWGGNGDYNITNSAAVVKLVNSYAQKYGMDIMWLMGHDHSKGEDPFIKVPGDTITSAVSFDDRTCEEITLQFTYGHSGYIGHGAAGLSAETNKYSTVTWGDEIIGRSMKYVSDGSYDEALSINVEREYAPVTVTISEDGKIAHVENYRDGLYARVAFVIERNGETGLFIMQCGVDEHGLIDIPEFNVPGLTVTGVNVSIVYDLESLSSPTPHVAGLGYAFNW